MTDPDEVVRIARGLTKAQRQAVLSARETMDGRWRISPKVRYPTLRVLWRKGISHYDNAVWPEYLTYPLGAAIRNHLKGQTDANKR